MPEDGVCQICDVAASEAGAGAPPWFAALPTIRPDVRRATPADGVLLKRTGGAIVGYDIPELPAELNASRNYVFAAAGIERDLFRT